MTLDQILYLLTSQKVYDQTAGAWRAYDGGGIEIPDDTGVLLQGLHGWLLREGRLVVIFSERVYLNSTLSLGLSLLSEV
jgi:hypothetical protein